MQLEVGEILEGKVTGILKFGAFVDLGGGKSGMVHISEVANTYVNDIKSFLTEGQIVKVKIIGIADDGKISLSIKKTQERPPQESKRSRSDQRLAQPSPKDKDSDQRPQFHSHPRKPVAKKETVSIEDLEYAYEPKAVAVDAGFEDMLSKFKASSEDRISGLKMVDIKKRGRRK